jgi:hypothetical protein
MFYSPVLAFILVGFSLITASATRPQRPKLSFVARVNATGMANIVAADQARAKALKARGVSRVGRNMRRSSSFRVTNTAVCANDFVLPSFPPGNVSFAQVVYTANVGVGRPATNCGPFVVTSTTYLISP